MRFADVRFILKAESSAGTSDQTPEIIAAGKTELWVSPL